MDIVSVVLQVFLVLIDVFPKVLGLLASILVSAFAFFLQFIEAGSIFFQIAFVLVDVLAVISHVFVLVDVFAVLVQVLSVLPDVGPQFLGLFAGILVSAFAFFLQFIEAGSIFVYIPLVLAGIFLVFLNVGLSVNRGSESKNRESKQMCNKSSHTVVVSFCESLLESSCESSSGVVLALILSIFNPHAEKELPLFLVC
jgi:hypothetical protein